MHCITADGLGLQQRQCHSFSAIMTSIMGQASQSGPTYSNAKHLLAFLSCLSVLYSKKQKEVTLARAVLLQHLEQCQVRICCFTEILHWDSPACFYRPIPDYLTPWWSFLLCESRRCWTSENFSKLWRRARGHKALDLSQGYFCCLLTRANIVCDVHRPLVWPSPEVECWKGVNDLFCFSNWPILFCI